MCGIAGFAGDFPKEILASMLATIAHRGPDDKGLWRDDQQKISLGHRRLSIIDLSPQGHQPMANEDKTIWLTYNGEIYNFRELRCELVTKGHHFQSATDSEVLIHLYEEFGLAMMGRLNGIFAFALWDGRKNELLVARDAFGVKPFYYAQVAAGFIFASEIKAILVARDVPREIDIAAVHQYLTYLWAPAPRTMLKSVKKLPPGHAMIVRHGKIVKEWRWYEPPYKGDSLAASETTIMDQLVVKLRAAVERQLVSDVPLGAFLSGGLDSSSIVAMMRQINPRANVDCYSIGFTGDKDLDGSPLDLPYAKKAASHLDVRLHEVIITPQDLIRRIEEFIYFLDEPQADPAPINAMLIAQRARAEGVKVLLSGAGGDDIFTGYRRHVALTHEKYWAWLPINARRWLATRAGRSGGLDSSINRRLQKIFAYADQPPDKRLVAYFKWSTDNLRQKILNPDVKQQLAGCDVEAPLLMSLNEIPHEHDQLNQMLYLELRHFLADHNLNYTDKTSMRYGVEVRVPFLDIDLVEFAAKIPTQLKQKGATGKAIFKKAMEPFLPRDIIYRPKTGFGAPLRQWVREDLRALVGDLLSRESLRARGLFDPAGVARLVEQNGRGQVDGAYTIFALLCMEIWCRRFLDQGRDN